jgi:hypothetical protein
MQTKFESFSFFFLGKNLLKKWTYMRDNWMMSYRKQNDEKSEADANISRKCIFYEQMLFFKKVAQHEDIVSSLTENTEETNEEMSVPKGVFLSEIFVHKLRVVKFRALQHAKENIGNRMK